VDESTRLIRHLDFMWQALLSALLPTLVLFTLAPAVGEAQMPVVTDITSSGLGTVVQPPSDGVYNITGGTRPGGGPHLFHSLGDFSIGQGDIANFLNDSGLPTANIIGRVTGGNPSNIDGIVRTTGFDVNGLPANLFLVNPFGILFGPHGSFDVTGSVSFSTAQYLRLFDSLNGTSANFYADPANDSLTNSVFAVAPIVDFGFLSPAGYGFLTAPDPNATITVQGSALSVLQGQSISLVGRKVVIASGTPGGGTVQSAQLLAPNGGIHLATAASPGEFDVNTLQSLPNNPEDPASAVSFTSYGSVSLAPGSSIDVSSASTVFVIGGQLVLSVNDATLSTSDNSSETPTPRDTVLLRQGSSIWTSNAGIDPGADVQLIASNVHLVDGSFIITQTSGTGRGGDVHLTADSLTIENSSAIVTRNSELGQVGGDLILNVGTLDLLGGESGGSQIASINNTGVDLDGDGVVDVTGVGGNLNIMVQGTTAGAGSMVLSGGSKITSDAGSESGNGGGISIRTTSLDLGEASIISSSTTGTGHGGDILVEVQELSIVDDATISSSTNSEKPIPAAGGTVTVQGLDGLGSMASSVLLSGLNTGIFSDSLLGLSGNVTVNAETLTITDGAALSIGSPLSGLTGLVTVTADSVLISAGGRIFSQSFVEDAGKVTITADELTLDKGSIVTSTTSENLGRGGDVELNVIGTVSMKNGASINSQSEVFSTGSAGNITVNAGSLMLANQSKITSSSLGTRADAGEAGNITIQSGSTVQLNNSSITTKAESASGGQITINAPDMVRLTNSEVSTSVKGVTGESNGGNISIDPQFVILQNSQLVAQANAGAGGAINVIAGVFIADPNSLVSASSQSGPQGTVNIQSPVQNVGGELAALSDEFASAVALLAQQCAARVSDGKFSTFVVAGREGLPMEPGGFLASPSLTAELFGSRFSGQNPQTQFSAVTGLFPIYDARPIQLAKFGNGCH
jgi:filamentous hemagglutinin family protein